MSERRRRPAAGPLMIRQWSLWGPVMLGALGFGLYGGTILAAFCAGTLLAALQQW